MVVDTKFENLFLNVSIKAALASYYFVGKKDKNAADKAAVDAMRAELNKINMKGKIVIGEGELDEAPMLFIGEVPLENSIGILFLFEKLIYERIVEVFTSSVTGIIKVPIDNSSSLDSISLREFFCVFSVRNF